MQQLAADRINQWQMVYDQEALDRPDDRQDPTFNITGWNSSYTGQPIPAGEMQEWVDQTVERIRALQPERVLEIGCGTGLLLFRIAPYCRHYHGADFSQTALNYVQQQLQRQPIPGVTLSRRLADDFEGLASQSFDTIIINSVIQYFPTVDYLVRVLTQAMAVLKPGGHLFIGDVRHFGLLELFHSSVQRYQALETLPLDQLRQRISRSLSQEEELVIDPAFFSALARHTPGVNRVEILLKRGHSHNELTRFRYDVILHRAGPIREMNGTHRLDWREAGLTLASLRQWLRQEEPALAHVVNIPNARLSPEMQALAWLEQSGGVLTPEGDLRQALDRRQENGVDPEAIWALEAEAPYQVQLSWANCNSDGSY
jgi:ubiquinone/menaquinone biosynthesis C-methylase UbiE